MNSEEPNAMAINQIMVVFILIFFGSALYYVLVLAPSSDESEKDTPSGEALDKFQIPKKGGALQNQKKNEDGYISLKLAKKIKVSEDTHIYRFAFQNESHTLGLPIGKHVVFSATIKGEEVCRKYTPISMITQRGYVDILLKVYYANVHPRFPEGGIMSQYVDKLNIGDEMLMEGPKGRLYYEGHGNFNIAKKPVTGKKNIGLISGGTGITPCYQVIQAGLKNNDGTTHSLVFGNRTTADILLKDELIALKEQYPDKFKLWLTLDVQPDPSENWQQGVGFITKEMLQKQMPAPGPDTLILYCGPPPFEKMMKTHLEALGYDDTMQFKF